MRPVRSFVRRQGRITVSQQQAFTRNAPHYILEYQGSPCANIGRGSRSLVVEVGFGMGDSLATMAKANPQMDFVGIEVHTAGVGRLMRLAELEGIKNLQIIHHDAVEVFQHMLHECSVDRLHVYFPDPWHKKKHHKRRLIQTEFLDTVSRVFKHGAIVHIATDWEPYREHIEEVFAAHDAFAYVETSAPEQLRSKTKFETRGEKLGHPIWDACYRFNR